MLRAVPSLLAASLIVLASVGSAQQKAPGDPTPVPPGPLPVAETEPVVPPRPTPAPVPPALRLGLAGTIASVAASPTAPKAFPTPPPGTIGLSSSGSGAGGVLRDADGDSEAWLGSVGYGVRGYGTTGGGFFSESDGSNYAFIGSAGFGVLGIGETAGGAFESFSGSGQAILGYLDVGVQASGLGAGGHFLDEDGTGIAYVGIGDLGIEASGAIAGGYFKDANSSGYGYVGWGDYGVSGFGATGGGYFKDSDNSGYGYVGFGNDGVRGFGSNAGGYFEDSDSSGYASVGYGNFGISAYGNAAGAYLRDRDGPAYAYVGNGDYGIRAYSQVIGGYFNDTDGSGTAYVAYDRAGGTDAGGAANAGEYGVYAEGSKAGAYFEVSDNTGWAYLGHSDLGIVSVGDFAGGAFYDSNESGYALVGVGHIGVKAEGDGTGANLRDSNSSSYADVASGSYKIIGSGAVSFVQNHPFDRESVIVYAAPEGDEIATYTRGTARLVDGEATVMLGATFRWVTNPDLGLTTYLTPVGEWSDLYVAERTTEQIVVRSAGGAPDAAFDYIVYGLRIGFEQSSIVQEKQIEAYIPAMADHRELYARRPELRSYNSLERFKGMHQAVTKNAELDLSRAHALRDAIGEFDPAVHELPMPPGVERPAPGDVHAPRAVDEAVKGDGRTADRIRSIPDDAVTGGLVTPAASIPVDDDGNVYATSFRPSSEDLASLVELSETVEPGDVLVIDRERPGMMRRATEASDSGVVGVVAAAPGLVLGTTAPARHGPLEPTEARMRDWADAAADETVSTLQAPAAFAGVVRCKVDAGYGAIWPGVLLVTSPTPGHAMRQDAPLPGTMLGKALEGLEDGTGTIRVLVMLR